MKKILFKSLILSGLFFTLASFTLSPSQKAALENPIPTNFKELKSAAAEIKGERLTLKEKIALKLFNKQLAKIQKENGLLDSPNSSDGKSQLIALLLVIFVGGLGIHRFYLGYTWQGVIQLLTAGGCGIWALIDLIRIITGDLKPKNGSYDKTL
ncbi:MAG: TM2 domain-containing protein [Bacteroidetes bacterium]|nr:TM2 domain-containing protein [Bacteroidota bacterium]